MSEDLYCSEFLHSQGAWQESQLSRLRGLRDTFAARHSKHWGKWGHVAANTSLRGVADRLRNRGISFNHGITFDFGLSFDSSEDEIAEFSERKARQCERLINRAEFPAIEVVGVLERCRLGADFMLQKRGRRVVRWEGRVCDPQWWRRKMRVVCARESEQVSREQGLTHRRAGCYVSEFTYRRWLSQQNRNRLLLEEMEAINQDGESFSVAELAKLSTSNPELRRGELMLRLRGFEEWADRDAAEWSAVFYTVTCPSKYHVFSGSKKNGKYGGFTPREGAGYLSVLWSRVRSKLARKGVPVFGFRIAEPHHDGCPHWHLLLFVPAGDCGDVTRIFREYALAEDGGERGAEKHRFTVEIIDRSRGSAAGYISKYISKNVDGYGVGGDLEAGDYAVDSALRVRAWASTWGIRQFQQIGGPPVTVYRELRRAASSRDRLQGSDSLELVLRPADAGDWAGFTVAMGGAVVPRKDRPARVEYSEREEIRGKYGDVIRKIVGVIGADFLAVSRWRVWVVRRRHAVVGAIAEGCRDLLAGVSLPWTGVNNCTGSRNDERLLL